MAEPLLVSPAIAGDPVTLEGEAVSVAEIAAAAGAPEPARLRALPLVPGVVLVHDLMAGNDRAELRWVRLTARPRVVEPAGPSALALVLTAPPRESGGALRIAARLRAALEDPAVVAALETATTREAVVRVLADVEPAVGESPLLADEVLALLGAGPDGLDPEEAARRRARCGSNEIERVRRRPLALRFLEQFGSFFAVLLWVAVGCAFAAALPELAWAILGVIVVNGCFSFFQEYRAERAVEALQRMLPHAVAVRRGGVERRVPTAELVPGDVVRLEEGDQVPADAQVVAAAGLRVDQSALTGESHPAFKLPARGNRRERVPRHQRHELVFAGTAVMAGSCSAVVCAVGMETAIGGIARLTQAVAEELSPLQREMRRVTRVVTALALAIGALALGAGVGSGLMRVDEGLVFALGIIVANVPEGLLPTLTLALALGVQRMARAGSVVKRLSAVEAIGATTVICTDKTGTVTLGRMEARILWAGGRAVPVGAERGAVPEEIRVLLEAATLASAATAQRGDPTEAALVAAAVAAGVDPDRIRGAQPVLAPYPFDSFRKRMTLVRHAGADHVAYVKGAAQELLALCTSIRWDGRTEPLTEERRRAAMADHDRLAAEGHRVLGVATRALPPGLDGAAAGAVERELTFLGLAALWDRPRPEVAPAMARCQRAGIRVIMITGDYGLTARAIGRHIGLPAGKIVTGEEVERLSPEGLRRLVAEPGVLFARASPAHKLAVVTALRTAGEVVAVTGDGVNDGPALKAAAVGVAMGRRGTEVAREAAVMVLTDDNFASIVTAIRQGRAIYENIGKFVTYIFASNVPELAPFLLAVFAGVPLPLTIMQILAVDLGTDLLPALGLGAEPPEPDVMDRPPRRRDAALLSRGRLLHAYGFLGVAEALCSLGAFFWVYWASGWRPGLPMVAEGALYRRATTMTFAGIVAAQTGNVFACRTGRESVFRAGLLGNRLVLAGVAAELLVLGALLVVPPLPRVFGFEMPLAHEWMVLPLLPVAMLALEEARKWLVRRRT